MVRQRGYTLIELMMVVVLIGISMAIAIPTMSTAVAETRQSEAALEVLSVFRSARAMAMRRGTPTLVSFVGAGQFWIMPARRAPGVVASCTSVDWPAELVFLGLLPGFGTELDFAAGTGPNGETFSWLTHGITATYNVGPPGAVCYSPLGRVYLSTTGAITGPYSDAQNAAPGGAVEIQVRRAFGNPRLAIVPMGSGMPRLRTQ
jgi:prepilin-type N-terminal cleavage/methylation domain-containing protein